MTRVGRVVAVVSASVLVGSVAFAAESNSRSVVSEVRAEPTALIGSGRVEAVASQSFVMVSGYVTLGSGDGSKLLRLTYSSEFLKAPVVVTIAAKPGSVVGLPGAFVDGEALSSCWRRVPGVGKRVGSGDAVSMSVLVEDLGSSAVVDRSVLRGVVKKRSFRAGFPENADNPGEIGDTTFVLRSGRKDSVRVSLTSKSPLGVSTVSVIVPASSNRFVLQGDWTAAEVSVSGAAGITETC
jgi:hypothetical protein